MKIFRTNGDDKNAMVVDIENVEGGEGVIATSIRLIQDGKCDLRKKERG